MLEPELILPLPERIRESLVAYCCEPHARFIALQDPRNRDWSIKVYLRRRRANTFFLPDFCLGNSKPNLGVLELEKAYYTRAVSIGLAQMQREVGIDAARCQIYSWNGTEEMGTKASRVKKPRPQSRNVEQLKFQKTIGPSIAIRFPSVQLISMDDVKVKQAVTAF